MSPTTPQSAPGMRTEPPVSVPMAPATKQAATAQPAPLLDPPHIASMFHGLRAVPKWGLTPVGP